MEEEQLYNKAEQLGLSPNEYIHLIFIHKGVKKELSFNEQLSRRLLIKSGYVDKSGKLTKKGNDLFDEGDDVGNIDEFRELFPKGILPNGRPAKSARVECAQKLARFVLDHNYKWSTIIKATKEYIKYYEKQDFNYMQTASNFISKLVDRVRTSTLAEWCEKVNSGEEISEDFDINV